MKLLILENDKTTMESIRSCWGMNDRSFEIISTGSEEEALRKLKNESYDAALIGLGLAEMDSIEVISRLRTFSWIPVIVVTARHKTEDIVKALEVGADDYVTKPFNRLELKQRVKVLVNARVK